jgi:hypothetical protein
MSQRKTEKRHMRKYLRNGQDLLLSGVAGPFLPSRSKVRGTILQVSMRAAHLLDAYSRPAATLRYLVVQPIQCCPPMVACA